MRALCIGFLWLFGACNGGPETPEQAVENDHVVQVRDLTGRDISDIDTPRARCIIDTINNMFGVLCRPTKLRYEYTSNLMGDCSAPNVNGCTNITDTFAYIYITIDGQRRPLQTYQWDPVGDVYVHEMTHLELFCIIGDSDRNHTRLIWSDGLVRRYAYAKQLATDAGCYNL
jgi:hypothetical protein